MKNIITPLLLLLFISCGERRQTEATEKTADSIAADTVVPEITSPVPDAGKQPLSPIDSIRNRVEWINTQKLEVKHFEFMCDEKMMVDYFYYQGEIVKIAVDFGTIGDVYAKEGYYYDRGKLIFIYEFVEGGPACEGCIKKNEYRSYIRNNKVIRYQKDAQVATCRRCEFSAASRHYKLLKATTADEIKDIMCR